MYQVIRTEKTPARAPEAASDKDALVLASLPSCPPPAPPLYRREQTLTTEHSRQMHALCIVLVHICAYYIYIYLLIGTYFR